MDMTYLFMKLKTVRFSPFSATRAKPHDIMATIKSSVQCELRLNVDDGIIDKND